MVAATAPSHLHTTILHSAADTERVSRLAGPAIWAPDQPIEMPRPRPGRPADVTFLAVVYAQR